MELVESNAQLAIIEARRREDKEKGLVAILEVIRNGY